MADTWETDSPEPNGTSNAAVNVSSDPRGRDQIPTARFNASTGSGSRSNIPSNLVSRSDITAPNQASTPRRGETVSSWLERERARTGNSNLQLSNTQDIERALTGNELVWDGNDFVDRNSPTFDPRGRDQLPPVAPANVQENPAEQSSSNTVNLGYGAGQIDPRLASAAGVGPTLAGSAPVTSATGSNLGSAGSSNAGAVGSGSSAGTASPQSFNDRYDFLTKQKVREGEHGGQHGGAGGTRPCGTGGSSSGSGATGSGAGTPVGAGGSDGGLGAQATGATTPPPTALVNGQIVEVGYGEGQVDPALARAAGGSSIGYGAGQVDPALARQVGYTSRDAQNVEALRSFNNQIGGGVSRAQLTPGERAYAQSRGYTGPSGTNPKPLPQPSRSNSTGPF